MLPVHRLEVELVGDIEIGRDRLGVAVDHDGFIATFFDGKQPMYAAVVELDTLTDAVRAAAEYDDLLFIRDLAFIGMAAFECRIEIGGFCLELGGTGVHHLIYTGDAGGLA